MHIPDGDAEELRDFVKKELRDNSDADPEVLAEYVVALLQADDAPEPQKRVECEQGLTEFLKGDVAAKIVDDIFQAIAVKAYKPGYVPAPKAKSRSALSASAATFAPTATTFQQNGTNNVFSNGKRSRKRDFVEFDADTPQSGTSARMIKQSKRNKRAMNTQHAPTMPAAMAASMSGGMQQVAYPGMPAFDPNDPTSMMMAMQTMMQAMAQFSAMMGMQQASLSGAEMQSAGRCYDYDNQGFCAKGNACPFEHGEDRVVFGPGVGTDTRAARTKASKVAKGKSKRRSSSQTRDSRAPREISVKRLAVSAFGDHGNDSNTQIVVENIPEAHYTEDDIEDHFQQFGEVTKIELLRYRKHKRAATVTFANHEAAVRAKRSRQAIFDDRFVRVFWNVLYNELAQRGDAEPIEEPVDPAELQRRIQSAQEAHEDKQKRKQQARAQRLELEDKIREHAQERRKLMQALRAKEKQKKRSRQHKDGVDGENGDARSDSELDDEDMQLRDKLAALEAEAELLGLDPDAPYNIVAYDDTSYVPRGRGGYRGLGRGRGRGRGAYRGGHARGGARGGVLRLDNRTRSITLNIAPGTAADEKMRQLMLTHFEVNAIEPHPNKSESQIITFQQRFMAEDFASRLRDVLVGDSFTLSWYETPQSDSSAATGTAHVSSSVLNGAAAAESVEERDEHGGASVAQVNDTSGKAGRREVAAGREFVDLGVDDADVDEDDDRFMD